MWISNIPRRFASGHRQMEESKQDCWLKETPYFWKVPSCNSMQFVIVIATQVTAQLQDASIPPRPSFSDWVWTTVTKWKWQQSDRNKTQSETTETFSPRSFINSSSKRTWGPCGNTWNTDQELNAQKEEFQTTTTKRWSLPEIHILDH